MTAVNYLWNPLNDNIVAEYDDAGNTIAEYTTEPEQFGNVVSQRRNGQDSYYHYDGVGSTLAVTDSTGAVTDTRSYTAFGETTEQTGNTVIPYQYVGQKGYYWDSEIGIYDVRRRSLSPCVGRWMSIDPNDLLNTCVCWYEYAHNRPLLLIDPSGLEPDDFFTPRPPIGYRLPGNMTKRIYGPPVTKPFKGCTDSQRDCIMLMIASITEAIISANVMRRPCISPDINDRSRSINTPLRMASCRTCRSQLNECIYQSLSWVTIDCMDNECKTHEGLFAHSHGICIFDKNSPIETGFGGPGPGKSFDWNKDITCNACSQESLKCSAITLCTKQIGLARDVTAEQCKRIAKNNLKTGLRATLLHESIHLCIGGNMTHMGDNAGALNLGREGLYTLEDEFLSRCPG